MARALVVVDNATKADYESADTIVGVYTSWDKLNEEFRDGEIVGAWKVLEAGELWTDVPHSIYRVYEVPLDQVTSAEDRQRDYEELEAYRKRYIEHLEP